MLQKLILVVLLLLPALLQIAGPGKDRLIELTWQQSVSDKIHVNCIAT